MFQADVGGVNALEEVIPGSASNVNLRVVPEDDGEFRRELVVRQFEDVVLHEAWAGAATVELRPNAQVPVHLLPVGDIVLGLHRIMDLTLPPAKVVHRYPSPGWQQAPAPSAVSRS